MWARKYEKCTKCGTTTIKHLARGLCTNCYHKDIERKHKKHRRGLGIASVKLTREYLIQEYLKKHRSLSDIATACGCSRQYVHKKMRAFGLPLRSLQSARRIALDRQKISLQRVDETGKCHSVIYKRITYNKEFFRRWTPAMAYVLGVIFTDGCLDLRTRRSKTVIRRVPYLSIAQKEPELLRKVLTLMGSNARISHRKRMHYETGVSGEVYYFSFICKPIYADLLRLGLNPQKSTNLQFPTVPNDCVRHFIRGCWDGDGTVYVEKRRPNYLQASYVSASLAFIRGMLLSLYTAGFPKRKIHEWSGKHRSYYFKYTGRQCTKLYHYLYDDVPPTQYLERKYLLFKKHCDQSTNQSQLFQKTN